MREMLPILRREPALDVAGGKPCPERPHVVGRPYATSAADTSIIGYTMDPLPRSIGLGRVSD